MAADTTKLPEIYNTNTGFAWLGCAVSLIFKSEKVGVCLTIETAFDRLQVRVTPGGRIRVGLTTRSPGGEKFDNVFAASGKQGDTL